MSRSTPIAPHMRRLRIIAQDPDVKDNEGILTAHVELPAENLAAGPWGYRIQVIDYDASAKALYQPLPANSYQSESGKCIDPFEDASDTELLGNPAFHAQNVYAIAMRILARFEFALGRRVSWSFPTHQVKIAPHAFADANAFYSVDDEALLFGYFPGRSGTIFTCLSHDVVAHETTHALLDGLRERFVDPSSPDQAAFHEGFSDIVALLSVFSLEEVVSAALDSNLPHKKKKIKTTRSVLSAASLTVEKLRRSALFSLAEQMGAELSGVRGDALRRSACLTPKPSHYHDEPEFEEPHRRGEILVAAVMNAFLDVWTGRLKALDPSNSGILDRERVVEEGAKAADHLLTIAIRALDYCMPVHITFGDFLSAVLTADYEVYPVDAPYGYRRQLRAAFSKFGIEPTSPRTAPEIGIWQPPELEPTYDRSRFSALKTDPEEMFRFIWENRKLLRLVDGVYTRVLSVRPCTRISPDGFVLAETVTEYMQHVDIEARELESYGISKPEEMPNDLPIVLHGGGTLIFDEFGRLKYNICNRLNDAARQEKRINYLWDTGFLRPDRRGLAPALRFSELHRHRATSYKMQREEGWV